jgi:hypothetical protein
MIFTHNAEYRSVKCSNAEYHNDGFKYLHAAYHYVERRSADRHYSKCCYTEHRYAKCQCTRDRGFRIPLCSVVMLSIIMTTVIICGAIMRM